MAGSEEQAAAARVARLPEPASIVEEAELTSPRGAKYRIIETRELDPYERPLAEEEVANLESARLTPGDDFAGTDRRDAKLSIVSGEVEPSVSNHDGAPLRGRSKTNWAQACAPYAVVRFAQ